MSEPPEDTDSRLVRPYVPDVPTVSGRTWSPSAVPPGWRITDPVPSPAAPVAVAATPLKRRSLVVLSIVSGIAIALTAIGLARPDGGDHRTVSPVLPAPGGPLMAATATAAPGVPPPHGTMTDKTPATTAPAAPPPSQPSSSETSQSSPSAAAKADRIVTVVSAANDCLDLNGGITNDGHHIQVSTCNGSSAQVWTLAADGTLRVKGVCAQETADTTVRVTTCTPAASTQWRLGDDGSIVNVASRHCLALPDFDPVSGHALVGSVCDGGIDQRWTVRTS